MCASTPTNFPKDSQKNRRGGRLCPPAENPVFTKIFGEFVTSHGRKPRPPLREGEIKPLALCARGFCDRVYKPGSVIDSHLSRRIVAGALQPPPRKQPGRPCFLHGVAPDRVYSNGRFHADACALTARFHPYLVGQTSYPSLRCKRQSSYIPLRLLCRQSRGFAGCFCSIGRHCFQSLN